MTAVLIALLGIAGTLAGVALTSRTQQRTTARAEKAADRRRLADQRVDAFTAFASDLIDYRRAELHRWHEVDQERQRGKRLDPDDAVSAPEARASRSAAWGSFYRLRLLSDDESLLERAEELLRAASGLEHAPDSSQVKDAADGIRKDLGDLADAARRTLVG